MTAFIGFVFQYVGMCKLRHFSIQGGDMFFLGSNNFCQFSQIWFARSDPRFGRFIAADFFIFCAFLLVAFFERC